MNREIERTIRNVGTMYARLTWAQGDMDDIRLAVSALKKQQPKPAIFHYYTSVTQLWSCPVCDAVINTDLPPDYCCGCGQRLSYDTPATPTEED